MVLIGGRGKAGGIKKAETLEETHQIIERMLDLTIHGYPVEKILIEEAVSISSEIYVAITTDPATFDIVLVTSAKGGIDIEEVAQTEPDEIFKKILKHNEKSLPIEISREETDFIVSKNKRID